MHLYDALLPASEIHVLFDYYDNYPREPRCNRSTFPIAVQTAAEKYSDSLTLTIPINSSLFFDPTVLVTTLVVGTGRTVLDPPTCESTSPSSTTSLGIRGCLYN